MRGKPAVLTENDRQQIVILYTQGYGMARIARLYEAGVQTVRNILILTNTPIHSFRGNNTAVRGYTGKIGKNHPAWKGGRIRTYKGYWIRWIAPNDPMISMAQKSGGGYRVIEHRLVVARALGRPLESFETVHHINGDRGDNRIKNLQLRTTHHGEGIVQQCQDCGSQNILPIAIAEVS